MNDRTRRMHRLADLAEKHERRSRRALGEAVAERDSAAHALQSVFLQCRDVAQRPDEFSVRFGRGLIEAGWLAEQDRRSALEAAVGVAETRQVEWHKERTRVDALGRLLERLAEVDAEDAARQAEKELSDLVSSRIVSRGAA